MIPSRFARLSRSALAFSLLSPLLAYSQCEITDTKSDSPQQTAATKTKFPGSQRPVESEPGGRITPEAPSRTRAESEFFWHTHWLWESRYVTEGRDNLAGKSLVSAATEASCKRIDIIPWLAYSPTADYSEFNLNIVYGTGVAGNIDLYAAYNYVLSRSHEVDTDDNEFSLDLVFTPAQGVKFSGVVYHSLHARGSFIEFALKRDYPLDTAVSFSVKTVLGVNAGYIADGHDGLNHFQIRIQAEYQPAKFMDLYAYAGANHALKRDAVHYKGDERLADFLWSGVGMSYRF